MANKKKSTVIGVVSAIVAILLAVLLIGLILKFTNGGSEDFKTFYVERDGVKLLSAKNDMDVESGKEYRFDVKYTFGGFSASPRDYSVKVVPNPDVDFEFMADNEIYTWQEAELETAFSLKKEATFFTVTVPEDLTLVTLLKALYPQKEISFDAAVFTGEKLYTILIASDNGKVSYRIDFDTEAGSYVKPADIVLDKDGITF